MTPQVLCSRALSRLSTGTRRLHHILMAASCTERGIFLSETSLAAPARHRRRTVHPGRSTALTRPRHRHGLASCAEMAALPTRQLPLRGLAPLQEPGCALSLRTPSSSPSAFGGLSKRACHSGPSAWAARAAAERAQAHLSGPGSNSNGSSFGSLPGLQDFKVEGDARSSRPLLRSGNHPHLFSSLEQCPLFPFPALCPSETLSGVCGPVHLPYLANRSVGCASCCLPHS